MEERVLLKIVKNDVGAEIHFCTNGKDDFKALVFCLSAVLAKNKSSNAMVAMAVLDRAEHPENYESEAEVRGKLPWED